MVNYLGNELLFADCIKLIYIIKPIKHNIY